MLAAQNLCIPLIVLGALVACEQDQHRADSPAFACQSEGVFFRQNTAFLCGSLIDPELVHTLENAPSNTETLTVNSGGGDPGIAMEIGRLVHQFGWRLEVVGGCLSACAHFLLPSSEHPIVIEENAIVGFHHTSLSIDNVSQRLFDQPAPFFHDRSKKEVAYYQELGLETDLLVIPFTLLHKSRMSFDFDEDSPLSVGLDYSEGNFVSFCFSVLEQHFSLDIEGDWECGQPLNSRIGGNRIVRFSYPDNAAELDTLASIQTVCISDHQQGSQNYETIIRIDEKCWSVSEQLDQILPEPDLPTGRRLWQQRTE